MAIEFIPLLLAFAAALVPGALLGIALLRGERFNKIEKALLGAVVALVAAPVLGVLETTFLGWRFTLASVVFNQLLLAVAAIALLWRQGRLHRARAALDVERAVAFVKANKALMLLLVILAAAFYARTATAWDAAFFEFDPYYYEKLTEKLVLHGEIETFTQEVSFPREAFQRWAPLTHYLIGGLTFLYQAFAGVGYDKTTLVLLSQLYPPFVAALLAFFAFVLVREEYGDAVALVPAAFFAFTPQLIQKFSAGVAEQQPFGVFLAIALFAVFLLALRRKSYRLGALAGALAGASILSSQQYIWPFTVLSAYIGIQSVLDYLAGELDAKRLHLHGLLAGGAIAGNLLMFAYQHGTYFDPIQFPTLLLAASVAGAAFLYGLSRYRTANSLRERATLLAGVGAVVLVGAFLTPVGPAVLNYIAGTATIAQRTHAMQFTIQEESGGSSALFAGAFGVLQPEPIMLFAAFLAALTATLVLLSRGKRDLAIGFFAAAAILILLNGPIDSILTALLQGTALADAVRFFADNNMFLYMLVALGATSLSYVFGAKKDHVALLVVLVIFPIAFIGFGKVKYLLHLGVALALATGYLLGEALRGADHAARLLKLDAERTTRFASTGFLVLAALLLLVQAFSVGVAGATTTMDQLRFNRIPPDWTGAYDWMRANTPPTARVMSWWDYGHWTTFFGERATVLDPNNAYGDFVQGTAFAFVAGGPDNLYQLMDFHQATHVLVDADLIQKWGALNFLASACNAQLSPVCPPVEPNPDWRRGPGQSRFEIEHAFEFVSLAGQCPQSASLTPMTALQSSFGVAYCATETEYYALDGRTGQLLPNTRRAFRIFQPSQPPAAIDPSVSYLVPFTQNVFVNINPSLAFANYSNNVLNAAFTRLFFFESLPGFRLVHRSPNGQVKIFEYTGRPSPAPQTEEPVSEPVPATADAPEASAENDTSEAEPA